MLCVYLPDLIITAGKRKGKQCALYIGEFRAQRFFDRAVSGDSAGIIQLLDDADKRWRRQHTREAAGLYKGSQS